MSSEVVPYENGANAVPSRKGWAARFPVYQIDFTAVASGKRIATTKRRVRWRFGFSNKEALENGETGTSCRGEEHDVTIVWSITSGKRLILADGQEVHYSNSRSSVLEYSWTMRGNHVLKLVAHAAPPMNAVPGFRQYDLHVDGQSFFQMPKVYELGIKGPSQHHGRVPGVYPQSDRGQRPADGRQYDQSRGRYVSDRAAADAPRTRQEEEADLQRAISASIEESRKHLQTATPSHRSDGVQDVKPSATAPAPALQPAVAPPQPVPPPASPETDLLGFAEQPVTAATPPAQIVMPTAAPPATSTPSNALVHVGPAPVDPRGSFVAVPLAPVQQGSFTSGPSNSSLPPAGQTEQQPHPMPADTFSAQPVASGAQPAVVDPFAPPPTVADDPFAPKPPPPPTYNDISSDILKAYSGDNQSSSQAPDETSSSLPAQLGPADYNAQGQGLSADVPHGNAPDNATAISTALVTSEPDSEPKSEVDQAMKKLINFDDISSPAEFETKLSMNPYEDEKTKAKKRLSSVKSVPIAPPAAGWGGAQPTLGAMKSARPPPRTGSIMQQPANAHSAAGAGALVLHGSQTDGGVPPIRRVSGFGVGASMPQGGYAQSSEPQLPHNQSYGASPQMQQQQPHPTQQRYNNY